MLLSRTVLSILAFTLLFVGCTPLKPQQPAPRPKVTAARAQPSARPPITAARNFGAAADQSAAVVRASLNRSQADLVRYRSRVLSLSEMISKLQEQGSASADNLKDLFDEVGRQDAYILDLIASLQEVGEQLSEEQELRRQAREKLEEVSALVKAKELEADQLRMQLSDAETTIDSYWQTAKNNHDTAVSEKAAADKVRGEKKVVTKILFWVSILAALSLIGNYLQFRFGGII